MRILIVTTSPVLPVTYGGRVRTQRLAVALAAAGAEVDVVAPWAPGSPRHDTEIDGARFHPHLLPANAFSLLFRDRLVPAMVTHSWQPYAVGPAQLLRPFADYDVVQFEHVGRARWMSRAPGRLKVYSSHNVELDFLRAQPGDSPLRGAMLRSVASLERRAVTHSDLIVACTDGDAERLQELHGVRRPTVVIPNGFDDELLARERPDAAPAREAFGLPQDARVLLFVGSAARLNLQATEFLVGQVLPALAADVRLLLVGDCGPATPVPEAYRGRVHAPGRVDDLAQAFAAADVAVNPMLSGSGSNVKLADYLASGLPVVTTPVGLRGFESHAGNVVVAEPEAFAGAIATLDSGSLGGEDVAELGWGRLGRRLHGVYADALAGRPPA